jgi:outer membrane lipoprotein-sorting protein
LRKENIEMVRRTFVFVFSTLLTPHPSSLPSGERDGVKGNQGRFTQYWYVCISLIILCFFLSGCPKKFVKIPPIEAPPVKDPIAKLLEAFSSEESLQAKTLIRINMVRNGEEMNFPTINGVLLYQKPDKLRILGYSSFPFVMGLFDALYQHGEFFLFIPPQKKAYTGEVSQFEDLIDKAGEIKISSEKGEGSEIPNRIWIEVVEKKIRVEIRLREISINPSLPEDSFKWLVPEGVKVQPLAELLKGKKFK